MASAAVSALRQKYEELQDGRASLQKRIKDIDGNLGTLDAAINLIDPEVALTNAVAASAPSALKRVFGRSDLGKEIRGQAARHEEAAVGRADFRCHPSHQGP